MKVVFALSKTEEGGAQVLAADLAYAFRQRGYDASLAALYPNGPMELRHGIPWQYCLDRRPASKADWIRVVRGARRFTAASRADVVFAGLPAANFFFPMSGIFGGGKKKMFLVHHAPVSTYARPLEYCDRLVGSAPIVDGIVCVSESVRQSLLGFRPNAYLDKTVVIPNALPLAVEQQIVRLQNNPRPRRPGPRRIVACGRLAPQKNLDVLIRAMPGVSGATLELIGHGPDEAALKQLAQDCGVADRVNFLGAKSREDALNFVAECDVFAQPSRYEGRSLALVEAAKLGLSLVVSNVPAQVEAAMRRDQTLCALTLDPDDPTAWARGLSSILADPTLDQTYRQRSKSLGAESDSFSQMVDHYEALMLRPRHGARVH
jgi:glycosyltransferase involved in cell wall biosynthesis